MVSFFRKSVITGGYWRPSLGLSPSETDELHILQASRINFFRTMLMVGLKSQDSCLCGGDPLPGEAGGRIPQSRTKDGPEAIFSTMYILSFQSDCSWSQSQRPHVQPLVDICPLESIYLFISI